MKNKKPPGKQDFSVGKRARQIFHGSLMTPYKSIAEGKVEDMRDGLRGVLRDVRQEFALVQLLLLDEGNKVTLPLISYPSETPPEAREMFDEVEPKVLGWTLAENSFICRVPKEYSLGSFRITDRTLKDLKSERVPEGTLKDLESIKNEEPKEKKEFVHILTRKIGKKRTEEFEAVILEHAEGKLIACIRLTEEEIKEEKKAGNIKEESPYPYYYDRQVLGLVEYYRMTKEKGPYSYYYYTSKLIVNEDADGPAITCGKGIGIERLSLPFVVSKQSKPWMEKLIMTGKRWSPVGSLPAMSSVLMFTLTPQKSGKERGQPPKSKKQRFQELEKQLEGHEHELYLLSWYILYSAFIFQTYALSQASADEPRRLAQELFRIDWSRLPEEKSQDSRKLLRRVEDMLVLPLPLEKRETSEFEFAKRRVLRDFANKYPQQAQGLWENLSGYIKPFKRTERIDQSLRYGALRHLKALYQSIHETEKKKRLKMTWSNVEQLLPKHLDLATSMLVLSAMEDIYRECDAEMQAEICDTLIGLVRKSIDKNIVGRRLDESVLVAISYLKNAPDNGRLHKLVEILRDSLPLVKDDGQDQIIECTKRIFATLEPSKRDVIMKGMKRGSELATFLSRKLEEIHNNLKELEESRYSPFETKHEKLKLKIVSVFSQKGGVGKTLIALALSHFLAEKKSNKVCLIELDFLGPTLWYWLKLDKDNRAKSPKAHLNRYLKEAFDYQIRNGEYLPDSRRKSLLDGIQWSTKLSNLKIIPCAVDAESQEEMLEPILERVISRTVAKKSEYRMPTPTEEIKTGFIKNELRNLLNTLYGEYNYVIFDTPAEVKEAAVAAAFLSINYGGINVFVSTFFDPAIQPLLGSIPLEFGKGTNYLLVNKIRNLDKQYVEDKKALLDFLGTRVSAGTACQVALSENLIDQLLNVKCRPVEWRETLEGFLAMARRPARDNWREIIGSLKESDSFKDLVKFVLQS